MNIRKVQKHLVVTIIAIVSNKKWRGVGNRSACAERANAMKTTSRRRHARCCDS